MDLNHLLHSEQVALINADRARSPAGRRQFRSVAANIRAMIAGRDFAGSDLVGHAR